MLDVATFNAATTGFATIVGLICNFASLRQSNSEKNADLYVEFVSYLQANHKEVLKQIDSNNDLAHSLKLLLSQGFGDIVQKLDTLDRIIAGVAANLV